MADPAELNDFLREFYQQLADTPLEPDDPRYVNLYEDPELAHADPVADLARTIEWKPGESKQLFSGFRGTGKSTELRRLRKMLQAQPLTKVVLCDMENYLDLTTPLEISDFLISVAGAFSDGLREQGLLKHDESHESYWTRAVNFLTRTEVNVKELTIRMQGSDVGAALKANLKADPTVRRRIQDGLRGRLGALSADINRFVEDCYKAMQEVHGIGVRVVLLLDSIERMRGTLGSGAQSGSDVASSLESVFYGNADKLGLPYIHVIYTVPPWLKIKVPGVAGLYDNSQQIPCVKVQRVDGTDCPAGLDVLEKVIRSRGDWKRLLGQRAALDRLSLASGGYLRDLFRLFQTLLRQSSHDGSLPADNRRLDLCEHEVRNSYLPIADKDAAWLARIDRDHTTSLPDAQSLPELARYYDTHLVLGYRNGKEWWSVHPLIVEHVQRQAERMARTERGEPTPSGE